MNKQVTVQFQTTSQVRDKVKALADVELRSISKYLHFEVSKLVDSKPMPPERHVDSIQHRSSLLEAKTKDVDSKQQGIQPGDPNYIDFDAIEASPQTDE